MNAPKSQIHRQICVRAVVESRCRRWAEVRTHVVLGPRVNRPDPQIDALETTKNGSSGSSLGSHAIMPTTVIPLTATLGPRPMCPAQAFGQFPVRHAHDREAGYGPLRSRRMQKRRPLQKESGARGRLWNPEGGKDSPESRVLPCRLHGLEVERGNLIPESANSGNPVLVISEGYEDECVKSRLFWTAVMEQVNPASPAIYALPCRLRCLRGLSIIRAVFEWALLDSNLNDIAIGVRRCR